MPASLHEQSHESYHLSSNKARLDHDLIHRYLSETAYWAQGRPRATVERSIEHSYLVMGAYESNGDHPDLVDQPADPRNC